MGTRNLVAVVLGGEYRIAQYGQWDGHPSGQGLTVLEFLLGEGNIKRLIDALPRARFLDVDGRDKEFIEAYEAAYGDYNKPDIRTDEQKMWFQRFISRDLGGKILESVASSEGEVVLRNSLSFAGDSLFCEFAYIIDLDAGVLEVYKGFNLEPITEGRFVPAWEKLTKFQLDSLPDGETFVEQLETLLGYNDEE